MNKKVLFIASYPKSGNTFMRAIISSLIYSKDGIFDFELFKRITLLDTNPFYDFVKKINKEDYLKLNNIDTACNYWQLAQKKHHELTKNFIFKTHAANLAFENHIYTSEESCMGVIYLVRDPRNIVPSYSYHLNISNNEVFEKIIKLNQIIFNPKENICAPLSNWAIHIKSWKTSKIPIIFVRYEDLVLDTINIIYQCIEFLNSINIQFNYNSKKIENIYESTKFEKLKNTEEKEFTIGKDKNFFRKGNALNNELNEAMSTKLKNVFSDQMKEFNYF